VSDTHWRSALRAPPSPPSRDSSWRRQGLFGPKYHSDPISHDLAAETSATSPCCLSTRSHFWRRSSRLLPSRSPVTVLGRWVGRPQVAPVVTPSPCPRRLLHSSARHEAVLVRSVCRRPRVDATAPTPSHLWVIVLSCSDGLPTHSPCTCASITIFRALCFSSLFLYVDLLHRHVSPTILSLVNEAVVDVVAIAAALSHDIVPFLAVKSSLCAHARLNI